MSMTCAPPRSFLDVGNEHKSASSRNVSSKVAIDERDDGPCRPGVDRAGKKLRRLSIDNDTVQAATRPANKTHMQWKELPSLNIRVTASIEEICLH